MVVIGGYTSSNTTHLAAICKENVKTYLRITAGASTPNNKIGETIERIVALRGSLSAVLG